MSLQRVAFSPLHTFTRATDETFFNQVVDSFGNVSYELQTAPSGTAVQNAYDPATGEPLGLQVFEQRTNLFTNSEFQTGVSGTGLITATTMDFGKGSVAAAAFGHDGATTTNIYGGFSAASTATTVSVFVEMDDGLEPSFGSSTGSSPDNDFAIIIGGLVANPLNYTVKQVFGNVYRVSGTATTGTSNLSGNGVLKYSSNSSRTFKWSGRQMESGGFITPYIVTAATTATRNASVAVINDIDESEWFNPSEGTFVVGFKVAGLNALQRLFFVSKTSAATNSFGLNLQSFQSELLISATSSDGIAAGATVGSINTSGRNIVSFRYNASSNSVSASLNGGSITSISPTSMSQILSETGLVVSLFNRIGSAHSNGHIANVQYYPTAVSNAKLQELSTL